MIILVVEPLAVFGMAYFSYLAAELFHFSGIIRLYFFTLISFYYFWIFKEEMEIKYWNCWISSTIGCGLVQAHYVNLNLLYALSIAFSSLF